MNASYWFKTHVAKIDITQKSRVIKSTIPGRDKQSSRLVKKKKKNPADFKLNKTRLGLSGVSVLKTPVNARDKQGFDP